MKSSKGKAKSNIQGKPIHLTADLSAETLQTRRERQDIFKVIIDIYVPIAIFIIGVDFVDLFPFLVFLDYICPFIIYCKAGWWY